MSQNFCAHRSNALETDRTRGSWDKSMSRPRVNGPRSLIVTTVEAPVRGFVSFTRVPNGSFLCAAVRPSGRNAWPLAVPEPALYCVALIEPLEQLPRVGAARA